MGVRVVHRDEAVTGGDYVRVSTSADPNDDTVTLATIQRVVESSGEDNASEPKMHVKTLVMEKPMSPDLALGLATCYARRKRIGVVYAELEEHEGN